MAGAGFAGKFLKNTALDKIVGPAVVGLVAAEAVKHTVANPMLEAVGWKKPSYVPPPAMSNYEQLMLGQQYVPGVLGTNWGAQQYQKGLIEKRFDYDQQRQNRMLDMQQNAQAAANRLAQMQIQNNSPLDMTRVLSDRDRHAASQNALASISASMANSAGGNQAYATNVGYSNTSYAPNYTMQQPMNMDAANYAMERMRGNRGRRGANRYGIDTGRYVPDGMPMTPDLQEQMTFSPEQMGQFSSGGAIARGYNSAKYGQVDNMVPTGVEEYAMGGYGPTGTNRRRGRRG